MNSQGFTTGRARRSQEGPGGARRGQGEPGGARGGCFCAIEPFTCPSATPSLWESWRGRAPARFLEASCVGFPKLSGCSWPPPWLLPGSSWLVLSPNYSWLRPGSSWLILAPCFPLPPHPGSSLAPPGYISSSLPTPVWPPPWLVLARPGYTWLILAHPGSF